MTTVLETKPEPTRGRRTRRRRSASVAAALTAGALLFGGGYALASGLARDDVKAAPQDLAARQAEVKKRGSAVMPFDLDRTQHVFTDKPTGGVQTVTANDPADAEQVRLIREHLRQEAERFRTGDFSDPARIHGDSMPGLRELRAGASRLDVDYTDLPAGARLTYRTSDPALSSALHRWFKAQATDHDSHHGSG